MLIHYWNQTVGPDDTVIAMGDLSMARRPIELISHRLNGKRELVPGNHDWCHPVHKKARGGKLQEQIKFYEDHGWKVRPIFDEYDIPGVARVNLCHMPYKEDSTDGRHLDWRLKDDGRFLICGHVHEKWTKKGRMINVGVDRHNYRPISMDRLIELINTPGDIA